MARRPRAEVAGGLYHIIARGNNRQNIFHADEDFKKFLSLLTTQKAKLGFYLYAYCLMSNHFHLLIERQEEPVGRIMLRVLTGYSQYYNRKYRKVGHVFQGRHKAILCEADKYLGELVRYIHLNPVRAKMVRKADRYPWSSQRDYLGIEHSELVDVDPVLRLFAARKQKARENFAAFVAAGARLGHQEEFYAAEEGCILGSEEFVDSTIHHIWESDRKPRRRLGGREFDAGRLIAAVEQIFEMPRENFCGPGKSAKAVTAKECLIVSGKEVGATLSMLAGITGLSSATVSKRNEAALRKTRENAELRKLVDEVMKCYEVSD
jgi:putative transposase